MRIIKDFYDGAFVIMVDNSGQKHLATQNLLINNSVYGEKIVPIEDLQYRLWDPFRSKLAGGIMKNLKEIPIRQSSKLLYLGASTGTTVSHLSDIVGNKGIVFAVESSPRVARELLENVSSKRKNIIPILSDARNHMKYYGYFGLVDSVYVDIAQPDQTKIAIDNCKTYLKNNGDLILIIKTRSIDVLKDPRTVTENEAKKLEANDFKINQIINLDPFDIDHSLIHAKYNP
ncbi:MAG: fibrillarin-like rRNA/tRNA 2'-O-methyltransferase [Thermoproteota archaeon]|nr:fibrillarin-like rRNA/tRNA 2'-O-methyltransferase [Thermoproteota archaeon]